MEWCGIPVKTADASDSGGVVHIDLAEVSAEVPIDADVDRPLAAAHLAACWHAGIVAELIHVGHRWQGVTVRTSSSDWRAARAILAPHFGTGLAGHGFSQLTALAVLTQHWPRVQQIAAHLIEHGTWRPEDDCNQK